MQIIKFKLAASSSQETFKRKRSLSFVPRVLPLVPKLDENNSVIYNESFHGEIGHSILTESSVKMMSQFGNYESDRRKCLSIWKNGLKLMPVFKFFNYQPNSFEDYKYFYGIINPDADQIEPEIDLPDEFFDSDCLVLNSKAYNELNSESRNNFDKSFDEQSLDFKFNESDLDEFDWSESEF